MRLVLSVAGATLVVLLVIAAAAFVNGMSRSLQISGDTSNVMLVGKGSEESIERSEISASVASLVGAAVKGLRTTLAIPHVSAEVHVALPLRLSREAVSGSLVLVRGVTPAALLVHDRVQIIDGRFPEAGQDELMIGVMVATKMGVDASFLNVGSEVWIDQRAWKIVGRFVAPGSVMEAEAWTILTDIKAATKRETDSCVVLALENAEFDDIDAFARQRLDLELAAIREQDYYAALSQFFRPIQVVAWATAVLIASGGLFGGLNTMYAAFASRVRELGTLQCIGYRRAAIVLSLVQESLLASLTGAMIACIISITCLDGLAVRFSMGVFGLVIDGTVVGIGLTAGVILGLVGAFPPAWRALSMPIPQSLKAV